MTNIPRDTESRSNVRDSFFNNKKIVKAGDRQTRGEVSVALKLVNAVDCRHAKVH